MSAGDIATQFVATAAACPDAPAVWAAGETLSYSELDSRSSSLASRLTGLCSSDNPVVGMMLPKSAEAVVAIMACLKANIPYAPVDPAWPERRRDSIFRQSGFAVVLF